jgi:lipopolysaccharide transport system permease protein
MSLPAPSIELTPPPAFVRRRVSIAYIVAELWSSRYLVGQFVRRDITVRYAQAAMGFAWALLMPFLIVCSGLVFRLVIATLANEPLEGASVASLAVKAVPWAFFSGGLSIATQSVIAHSGLIGKIYFPRESLPIAAVLGQCTDLIIGLVILAVMLPFMGVSWHWTALGGVGMLLLLVVFTAGFALLLSCANLFYRDVKYIVQMILNFGIFATPVFFEPQMLGRKGAALMLALPLSPFIQGADLAIVHGHNLLAPLVATTAKGPVTIWEPWMLGYAVAASLLLLCAGLAVFRRASSRFAEMA